MQGCRELDDWGLTADVACYCKTSERIRELMADQEQIDSLLTGLREVLDLVAFRLGLADAAGRLTAFRNLGGIAPSDDHDDGEHAPWAGRVARGKRAHGRAHP